MTDSYIVDAVRTPRGKDNDRGSLKGIKPALLLAQALRALAGRNALGTAKVAEAVFGCVTQTGEQGSSVGTLALASWSQRVPAVTLNRCCASSLTPTNRTHDRWLLMRPCCVSTLCTGQSGLREQARLIDCADAKTRGSPSLTRVVRARQRTQATHLGPEFIPASGEGSRA